MARYQVNPTNKIITRNSSLSTSFRSLPMHFLLVLAQWMRIVFTYVFSSEYFDAFDSTELHRQGLRNAAVAFRPGG